MPVYPYRCEVCNETFEEYHSIMDRDNASHCGKQSIRLIAKTQGKPVVLDYYSEGAGAHFTGPKQKERVLRDKGLSQVSSAIKEMKCH